MCRRPEVEYKFRRRQQHGANRRKNDQGQKMIKIGASYNQHTFNFHGLDWTCVQNNENLIWKFRLGILLLSVNKFQRRNKYTVHTMRVRVEISL